MRVGGRAGLCVSCSLVLSPGVSLQGQRGVGRMLTEEGECRAWRHILEFDFADSAGLIELSPLMLSVCIGSTMLHPPKDLVDLFARVPSPAASTISVLCSHFQCDFAYYGPAHKTWDLTQEETCK